MTVNILVILALGFFFARFSTLARNTMRAKTKYFVQNMSMIFGIYSKARRTINPARQIKDPKFVTVFSNNIETESSQVPPKDVLAHAR